MSIDQTNTNSSNIPTPDGYFYRQLSGVEGYFKGELNDNTKRLIESGEIEWVKPYYFNRTSIKAVEMETETTLDTHKSGKSLVVDNGLWYVGAQNDGLFIINAKPRPSNDYPIHDRNDGPTLVLNCTELPLEKVQAICDAHNAAYEPIKVAELEAKWMMTRHDRDHAMDRWGQISKANTALEAKITVAVDAIKEAKSVINSINRGVEHKLVIKADDKPVYWQREEWVNWAINEILPKIDNAINTCSVKTKG